MKYKVKFDCRGTRLSATFDRECDAMVFLKIISVYEDCLDEILVEVIHEN